MCREVTLEEGGLAWFPPGGPGQSPVGFVCVGGGGRRHQGPERSDSGCLSCRARAGSQGQQQGREDGQTTKLEGLLVPVFWFAFSSCHWARGDPSGWESRPHPAKGEAQPPSGPRHVPAEAFLPEGVLTQLKIKSGAGGGRCVER